MKCTKAVKFGELWEKKMATHVCVVTFSFGGVHKV